MPQSSRSPFAPPAAIGHDDLSKPVITTETRKGEDGKDVLYMFIDGVKVHEIDVTKQPLPPVVTPAEGALPQHLDPRTQ